MIRLASFPTQRQGARRSGFTLIEILVVLAIAAIISSVTLGGFKEMTAGNKRVACSTNLTQLYQAARLYAADEGGKFPVLNFSDPTDCTSAVEGIGLWTLYTFPQGRATSTDFKTIAPVGAPVERYLRSAKSLHCPSDLENEQLYADPDNKTTYNPAYLSYQACDDGGEISGSSGVPTYATQRVGDTSDANWQRQLLHFKDTAFTDLVNRQPAGDTIVTYCLHHRGDRKMDNVLFYDGSIQLLPQAAAPENNWKREPKAPQ